MQQEDRTVSSGKHIFFPVFGIVLLALSLVGFSDNLFTDVGQPTNSDPKFIVHGIFALAWFLLIAIQPFLIRRRNVALHRTLGFYGMFVAAGLVVSTAYIRIVAFQADGALGTLAIFNTILMTGFVVCIVLAYRNRSRAEVHKRLIMVGTLLIMAPTTDRVAGHIGAPPILFTPLTWVVLFLAMIIHDRIVLGKFSKITLAGFAFLIIVILTIFDHRLYAGSSVEYETRCFGLCDHLGASLTWVVTVETAPVGAFVAEDLLLDLQFARRVEQSRREAAVAGRQELEPEVGAAGFAECTLGPFAGAINADMLLTVDREVLARQRAIERSAPAAAHVALA